MDKIKLMQKIPDGIISRKKIYDCALEMDSEFREGQMKRLLEYLVQSSEIEHIGRNQYRKMIKKDHKLQYESDYSKIAEDVLTIILQEYPNMDFCIWELTFLNEFFNHQLGRNYIFLEVENEGCEFVFDRLIESYPGKVLLKPRTDEIMRYAVDGTIIIDRLVSESPRGQKLRYNIAPEKLIVDLFANKKLKSILSQGDYAQALENICSVYEVDPAKMFRYARRRNKEKELYSFLRENVQIGITV